MVINTQIWSEVDIDEFKILQIVKVPQMLSLFLPELNKEYLVYDFAETMKLAKEEIDLDDLIKTQKEFQTKTLKFIKDIQKDFKPGFKIVSLKESKTIDKEKVKVYEMKLDDKTLKELTKLMGDHILNNETFVEFLEGYSKSADDKLSTEEIEVELSKLKDDFHKFMDKFKDIQILGDEGIKIQYAVNKQGYIVEQIANYDFEFNLKDVFNTEEEALSKGKVKFNMNYSTKNYNINSKDITVEMPKVNKEDTINILDIMEKQLNTIKQ